ncbi:MAG: UvrD-helicase domain-containing protein [Candidatus Thiodiazotropha sp.]
MSNKLIVAAAGAGKTSYLVKKALSISDESVLITTFTEANEKEIRIKFYEECGCVPGNVTVQTWFSFLIQHGVKPYQGSLFEEDVNGMILVEGKSGVKYYNKRGGFPVYYKESEFDKYYFTDDRKIYSDKLPQLVLKCNESSKGMVIRRISRCFQHIYIDEMQDLAGYDLDFLKILFESDAEIILVGDPRQGTYSTSNSAKYKRFSKSKIIYFFEDDSVEIETDDSTLSKNYRCTKQICDMSNALYPDLNSTTSGNTSSTGHDGVFLIDKYSVEEYLKKYKPVQLRDSRKTPVNENYQAMNFGASKGLTFERALIYPTGPMLEWLKNHTAELKPTSRAKLYVGLTRAKQSVAIVGEFNEKTDIEGAGFYSPS